MTPEEQKIHKNRILMGIYRSSWGASTLTLCVVAVLEVFMLVYSVMNSALYGPYLWKYRSFYIVLLAAALIYLALNAYVKRDMERRYAVLHVANPVYAVLFFGWALGITWSDVLITGVVDPVVFITFSLTILLGFYLSPTVYAVITAAADALIIAMVLSNPGYVGVLINLSIFIIFQFVLGLSYLRLKTRLTERVIEEKKNAGIDVLTGFPNRRTYTEDMQRIIENPPAEDMVYIAVDMNGLKQVNDSFGHDAGDQVIIGAAECLERCFEKGARYRVGGDEFAVLIPANELDVDKSVREFDKSMKLWTQRHGLELSASCGCVRFSEFPDSSVIELAKIADERMYEAKARYYQENGKDRRRMY